MENPSDFQFPPNQTQHNPGPINAGHKASTLPKTENTMRRSVAGRAIDKAKAHIPDLNVPLVQYECALCGVQYHRLRAICGHMKKHRNRSWKGLKPPSTGVSFGVAGRAIFKAEAHIPNLNVPLVQYECALCGVPYDRLRAICGHMKKHRNRSWKGLEPPFNLNEVPKDDD